MAPEFRAAPAPREPGAKVANAPSPYDPKVGDPTCGRNGRVEDHPMEHTKHGNKTILTEWMNCRLPI